jgi:hypothetical protein
MELRRLRAGAVSAAALVIGAEEVMFSSVMLAASTAQVHGPPYIPAVRAIAMQDGKANCGKWFECPARFSCNVTSTDMHFPQNFTLREEWSASSGGSAGAYAGLELQMCTYTQFPGMCSNPSDPPKKLSFWVQLLGTFYSWKKPITVAALGISLEDRIPDSQQIVGVSSQCIDYCYQLIPSEGVRPPIRSAIPSQRWCLSSGAWGNRPGSFFYELGQNLLQVK